MVIVVLGPRCRPSSARSAGSHSSAFMTRQLTPLSKNSETMTGYYENMVIGSWNKMQICSIQDTSQKKCPNQTILMIFFPGVRWKFLRWAILGRCWRSWHSGPEILVGGTKVFDEKRWETIDEIFDFCKYCGCLTDWEHGPPPKIIVSDFNFFSKLGKIGLKKMLGGVGFPHWTFFSPGASFSQWTFQ